MEDGRTERNDRILGVATVSHLYARGRRWTIWGRPSSTTSTSSGSKDSLEGKRFTVIGVRDPQEAVKLIRKAAKAAK